VDKGPADRGGSVRHEISGTVTKGRADGSGRVRGTIPHTVLARVRRETGQIVSRYKVPFRSVAATERADRRLIVVAEDDDLRSAARKLAQLGTTVEAVQAPSPRGSAQRGRARKDTR